MDVVINNEYQIPLASIGLHIVEGVSACGEVKTKLTTGELDDIVTKGSKQRVLRYVQSDQNGRVGQPADFMRFHQSPPYFAIALETNVVPATVLERLQAAPYVVRSGVTVPSLPPVDALFVLGDGCYINYGEGGHRFGRTDTDGDYKGWAYQPAAGQGVLTTLFGWLHGAMPEIMRYVPGAGSYLFPSRTRTVGPTE